MIKSLYICYYLLYRDVIRDNHPRQTAFVTIWAIGMLPLLPVCDFVWKRWEVVHYGIWLVLAGMLWGVWLYCLLLKDTGGKTEQQLKHTKPTRRSVFVCSFCLAASFVLFILLSIYIQ